jgi:hypothetical protein
MEAPLANRLVKFWNLHLTNKKAKSRLATSAKPTPVKSVTVTSNAVLQALINKVGREEAIRLLSKAGKLDKYADELLTVEELVGNL